MKQMVCEMCESTAFMKEVDEYVCRGCGMKYSPEAAKKLMVEVEGGPVMTAPAAPQSNELENLYELARRARKDDNGENAAKYYEMILLKAPMDWEAAFFSVYYKATQCKIAHICSAANSVENCLGNVFALIRDYVKDPAQQKKAVADVVNHSELIAGMLANGAKHHYNDIDAGIRSNYTQEMINNVCAARDIVYTCGNKLEQIFGETCGVMCAEAWKQGVKLHEELLSRLADQTGNRAVIKRYVDKISKYDETYASSKEAAKKAKEEKERRNERIRHAGARKDAKYKEAAIQRFRGTLLIVVGIIAGIFMFVFFAGKMGGLGILAMVCLAGVLPVVGGVCYKAKADKLEEEAEREYQKSINEAG